MAAEWYINLKGEIVGPVSGTDLRSRAAEGVVKRSTMVRQGAGGNWVEAWHVDGLFSTPGDGHPATDPQFDFVPLPALADEDHHAVSLDDTEIKNLGSALLERANRGVECQDKMLAELHKANAALENIQSDARRLTWIAVAGVILGVICAFLIMVL
jgi:hypothetical protein